MEVNTLELKNTADTTTVTAKKVADGKDNPTDPFDLDEEQKRKVIMFSFTKVSVDMTFKVTRAMSGDNIRNFMFAGYGAIGLPKRIPTAVLAVRAAEAESAAAVVAAVGTAVAAAVAVARRRPHTPPAALPSASPSPPPSPSPSPPAETMCMWASTRTSRAAPTSAAPPAGAPGWPAAAARRRARSSARCSPRSCKTVGPRQSSRSRPCAAARRGRSPSRSARASRWATRIYLFCGKKYNFMALGTYRLAKMTIASCGCDLEVQAFMAPNKKWHGASSNVAVAMKAGEFLFVIRADYVDGRLGGGYDETGVLRIRRHDGEDVQEIKIKKQPEQGE